MVYRGRISETGEALLCCLPRPVGHQNDSSA